jgi:hypothetical protein
MYDEALLARIGAQEEEIGPRGGDPVPDGMYLMAFSAETEVDEGTHPRIRPIATILEGEYKNRVVRGDMISWFAAENSNSAKTAEEREKMTRRISRGNLMAFFYQVAASGDETTATELLDNIESLNGDPSEVQDTFQSIASILEGANFVGLMHTNTGKSRSGQDTEYHNFRPYVHLENGKDTTVEQMLEDSWSQGLRQTEADEGIAV